MGILLWSKSKLGDWSRAFSGWTLWRRVRSVSCEYQSSDIRVCCLSVVTEIRSHKTKVGSVGGIDKWTYLSYIRLVELRFWHPLWKKPSIQADLDSTFTMLLAPALFFIASSVKIVSGAGMFTKVSNETNLEMYSMYKCIVLDLWCFICAQMGRFKRLFN